MRVFVRLKEGVLDVQGKAVQNSIASLDYKGIEHVRIGKVIEFDIAESDFTKAKKIAEELCDKLLVNPIIEDYEIRSAE